MVRAAVELGAARLLRATPPLGSPTHPCLPAPPPLFSRTGRFVGGTTNTCYNAVDRHIAAGRGDQQALIYDSPQTSLKTTLTYTQLRAEVEAAAGMLRAHGVGLGDRVIVYMPMIPETLIAMLACEWWSCIIMMIMRRL